MWKKNRKRVLALGLTFSIIIGMAGCGKEEQMKAETNPDTPVSEVQFPLKEKAELSFITGKIFFESLLLPVRFQILSFPLSLDAKIPNGLHKEQSAVFPLIAFHYILHLPKSGNLLLPSAPVSDGAAPFPI